MAELNSNPEKSKKSSRNRVLPRVDLTAMVDLAFLLITFFMLTTTLQKNNALSIAMPDKTDGIKDGVALSRTLTICLGAHNKVMCYMGTPDKPLSKPKVIDYSKNGLRANVLEQRRKIKAATGKDIIILVKPSDHSIYDNLVNTIDEMNIASINRYAIVAITSKDVALLKQQNVY